MAIIAPGMPYVSSSSGLQRIPSQENSPPPRLGLCHSWARVVAVRGAVVPGRSGHHLRIGRAFDLQESARKARPRHGSDRIDLWSSKLHDRIIVLAGLDLKLRLTRDPLETIEPQPVVPISPPSAVVTSVLTLVLLAALAGGIFSLARPSLIIETVDDATHYRVDPECVRRSAALLVLAAAATFALIRRNVTRGLKKLAVMLMTVAVVCLLPVWHQSACHVIVTPTTVTAPLRGGLAPGAMTTVGLDNLADIYFQGERTGSRYQIFRTKAGGRIDLDFGPAAATATAQVDANAQALGVRVHHSF